MLFWRFTHPEALMVRLWFLHQQMKNYVFGIWLKKRYQRPCHSIDQVTSSWWNSETYEKKMNKKYQQSKVQMRKKRTGARRAQILTQMASHVERRRKRNKKAYLQECNTITQHASPSPAQNHNLSSLRMKMVSFAAGTSIQESLTFPW